MIYPREEPNMPNVRVWSNDTLDELDRELLDILKKNRNRKRPEYSAENAAIDRRKEEYSGIRRLAEYILLILTAIALWFSFVNYTLQYLKFPVQRYIWWVRAVYIAPILCIFTITALIDCCYDGNLAKRKQKIS